MEFIENLGGQMQYLRRHTEYNVIYYRLYDWIPNEAKFNLRPGVRNFFAEYLSSLGHGYVTSMSCESIISHELELRF